jgi:hypothetical protein
MENALFYTFSTIPQVLAAAIALLAAFVLYRLQSTNSQIEEKSSTIQQGCLDVRTNGLWELHVDEKYEEVFNNAENFRPTNEDDLRLYVLHRTKLGKLIQSKKDILSSFIFSLIITISLIIASLIVLPFTTCIKSNFCATWTIFSVGILWFIVCIVSYGILAKRTISD